MASSTASTRVHVAKPPPLYPKGCLLFFERGVVGQRYMASALVTDRSALRYAEIRRLYRNELNYQLNRHAETTSWHAVWELGHVSH